MPDRSLPRTERLRSLGAVRRLFESGESGFVYPFRYVWFAEPDLVQSVEVPLFRCPRSSTKGPTDAEPCCAAARRRPNRLQKNLLRADAPVNLDLALIYSSKEVVSYKTIAHAVRRILESVVEHL